MRCSRAELPRDGAVAFWISLRCARKQGCQKRVYDVVHDNPGLNTKQIADILNKSPRTVEKHLTFLRTKSLIVHKDSDKTGGYYPL